jgi:hypothetical protein
MAANAPSAFGRVELMYSSEIPILTDPSRTGSRMDAAVSSRREDDATGVVEKSRAVSRDIDAARSALEQRLGDRHGVALVDMMLIRRHPDGGIDHQELYLSEGRVV